VLILRLSHIGVCVSDLDKSIAFYCGVFEFQEISRIDVSGPDVDKMMDMSDVDLSAVYLERDQTRIELLHFRSPAGVPLNNRRPLNQMGITHFSFRVSDLDHTVTRVVSSGGVCLTNTKIENPEKRTKSIFVLDPDGTMIELLEMSKVKDWLPGMSAK